MAILPPWHHTIANDPFDTQFEITDIAIGGKLIQAKLENTAMDQMKFHDADECKRAIKQKIASELARVMVEGNLIEFTRLPQNGRGTDIICARCYLAPNEQVKVLRTHYTDKK